MTSDGNRTSLSSTIAGQADFINYYGYDGDDRETSVTQTAGTFWHDYGYGATYGNEYGGGYGAEYGGSSGENYETPTGYEGDAVAFKQADFAYDGDGRTTSLDEYGWQLYPTQYSSSGLTLAQQATYGFDNDSRLTSLDEWGYGGYGGYGGGYGNASTFEIEQYSLQYDADSRIYNLTNAVHSSESCPPRRDFRDRRTGRAFS